MKAQFEAGSGTYYDIETAISQNDTLSENSVLKLQKILNRLGIHDERGNVINEDGISGRLTTSAVMRFQRIVGLNVDGFAGEKTWDVLNSIISKTVCSINNKPTAEVTRYLQYAVGTGVDGIWGERTTAAVILLQKKNNLPTDGIVDTETWEKLIG